MNKPNCCGNCFGIRYSEPHTGKIDSMAIAMCTSPACECHTVKATTPNEQPWEGEFDAKFDTLTVLNQHVPSGRIGAVKDVKDFIRSKLSAEREVGRQEVLAFVESMKNNIATEDIHPGHKKVLDHAFGLIANEFPARTNH